MDSYKGSNLDLPDEVCQPSESQAGGWSLQQQQDYYRPAISSTETSRNVYPETSRNESSLIFHNGYTRPPYSYPPASIAGPNTPNEYADSQMVIARTSSSSSLMSTGESYGSPARRFDWQLQLQQAPDPKPFLDDFGPAAYEWCMKTAQEEMFAIAATSYQETTERPSTASSHNLETGNWTTPVEASYSTSSTHKVLSQLELLSRDSLQAQDNKAKSTLGNLDSGVFTQAFKAGNQHLSIKLDSEPHNNLSVSIGDKTEVSEELAQVLKGIKDIDPLTVDLTQLNQAGQLVPLNQAQAILLPNGGSTNLMQPMNQPPHTEQDSFPSQPCTHCGRYDNPPPDKIVPQVSTPILLMDWEQFRKKLQDGELSSVLIEIASNAKSRPNFAANLNRRIFSEEERRVSNVSGTKKKKKLDPDWIDVIKENVFRYWPFEPGKPKINAWRECIRAIDTANRQLKHKLKKEKLLN